MPTTADAPVRTACAECACADAIPARPTDMGDDDPCLCGHALRAHVGTCSGCDAEVRGLDVACRHCGALLGDEIERTHVERNSGLAIASFAIGLLAPIAFIVAIGLGVVAIRQMRTRPHLRGRGFAIAGIALGCFWLLMLVVGLVLEAYLSTPL